MLLHVLLAVAIPNLKFDEKSKPDVLKVEIMQLPEPTPPSPEPIEPQPEVVKPNIEPKIKPLPKPIIKPLPTPIVENSEPISEPPPAPPTEIIAVAPKADAPAPAVTVNVPVKVEPVLTVSQTDIDDARSRYGNALWGAISKHKKYPKVAAMRGWQGEAVVELELDGNGKLKAKKISQSSGHEILDKQALEMVEKALPLPVPPEALRGTNFTITIPIPFKLE
jgi:protein TonB